MSEEDKTTEKDVVVKKIDSLAKEWKVEFQEIHNKLEKEKEQRGEATAETKRQMEAVQDRLDELETNGKMSRPSDSKQEIKETEQKGLRKLFRAKGDFNKAGLDPDEQKLLSSDIDPQGGYIAADTQFAQSIISPAREMSPVRQVANVQTISVSDSMKFPIRSTDAGASWGGERSTRSETDTPDVELKTIYAHELYAYPKVTLEMIEDGQYDVVSYVQNDVNAEFAQTEGEAHIDGDGNNKPLGILQASGLTNVPGAGSALDADEIITVFYEGKTEYARNGTWGLHRKTIREVRQLKATDDNYLWQPGLSASEPPAILGQPYVEMDDMAAPAANGNFSTGDVSMLFGDWNLAYGIVDRVQISIQEDRVTAPGFVNFYIRKRTGGAPLLEEALTSYTMA